MNPSAEELRVLSSTPGRIRLHLPDRAAGCLDAIEDRLARLHGVGEVRVNLLTGNALLHFDTRTTDETRLLAQLKGVWREHVSAVERRETATSSLLRIGVRGIVGHAVVDSIWFAAGFLGQTLGLPLAGLGPLHVLMDLAVWGLALKSCSRNSRLPAS
jgi:hypothetical protein